MTLLSKRRAKKLEKLIDKIFSPIPCYDIEQSLNEIVNRTSPDINAAVRLLVKNLIFTAKHLTEDSPYLTQRH